MGNLATHQDTVPHVFVLSDASSDHLEMLRTLTVRDARPYLTRGVWIWCLQTFLELRDRGLPVQLMRRPQQGAINFMHVRQLRSRKPQPGLFIVSIQADYGPVPWTSINIVQNLLQADQKRSFWIPHWPQPGLIPRGRERNRVECVAYAGNDRGLAGSRDLWSSTLKSHAIEFRYLDPEAWNDYSGVDVLLAIRSFDQARHACKPPSKLLNAWHARVPLVGGYDSAFEQVGRPDCDYLRASTFDQAIKTIRRLRDDPVLYRAVVDAGEKNALRFTRDRVGDAWESLISGPISDGYARWQKHRPVSEFRERLSYNAWCAAHFLRSLRRKLGKHRTVSTAP